MQHKACLLFVAAVMWCAPIEAQVDLKQELKHKFEAELHRVDVSFDGVAGAEFIDLTSGEEIGFNSGAVLPTASVIKVPVLIELYRQAESKPSLLTEKRAVTARTQAGGSGLLKMLGDGTSTLALEDLAKFMINISDNTAANMVIDEVGMDNVNKLIGSLGFGQMKLKRHMMDSAAQAR